MALESITELLEREFPLTDKYRISVKGILKRQDPYKEYEYCIILRTCDENKKLSEARKILREKYEIEPSDTTINGILRQAKYNRCPGKIKKAYYKKPIDPKLVDKLVSEYKNFGPLEFARYLRTHHIGLKKAYNILEDKGIEAKKPKKYTADRTKEIQELLVGYGSGGPKVRTKIYNKLRNKYPEMSVQIIYVAEYALKKAQKKIKINKNPRIRQDHAYFFQGKRPYA